MSKHHRHHKENRQMENTQSENNNNNKMQNNKMQNNNPFSQLLGGGGNDLINLISGLNGGKGANNSMPNVMGEQNSNQISDLMSSLGGGGNPLANIMASLSQTDISQLGNLLGGMNNSNGNANMAKKSSSKENMKVNDELKNLASDFNNVDINEISNIVSNIDFDEVDFENMDINEIMNNISGNIVEEDNEEDEYEENDEVKHNDINENTYNVIKDAKDEDILQMFNILAQLIDKRKLKILREVLKSCH